MSCSTSCVVCFHGGLLLNPYRYRYRGDQEVKQAYFEVAVHIVSFNFGACGVSPTNPVTTTVPAAFRWHNPMMIPLSLLPSITPFCRHGRVSQPRALMEPYP
jgi:hypothetical protein